MNGAVRTILATTTAAVLSQAAARAAATDANPTTLCQRLAAQARNLPSGAWSKGSEAALKPALLLDNGRVPNRNNEGDATLDLSLTQLPWVRETLSNEAGNWTEFVSRLPGKDIYMVSTFQGTLHCQSMAFVRATGNADPQPAPQAGEGESDGPCWTQSADLGSVFGEPAFVEHGTLNDHTFDAALTVVPWSGVGWAPGCTLTLTFRTRYRLVARHCVDTAVCHAAERQALPLATAYNAFRAEQDHKRHSHDHFRFGPPAPTAIEAAVKQAPAANGDALNFPRFGDPDDSGYGGGFSYSGFAFLPLQVGGRWLIATVGHEGVGWRESNRTLIALYNAHDGQLTPEASLEINAVNAGLVEAATTHR